MLLTLLTAYSYLTPAGLRRRLPRDLRGGVLFRHALPQLHRRSGAHWYLQRQLPAHLRHVGCRRHAAHGACHARHLPSRGAPPQGLAAPQLGDSAVAIAPRLAALASWGRWSRLAPGCATHSGGATAPLRAQPEAVPCGSEARPKVADSAASSTQAPSPRLVEPPHAAAAATRLRAAPRRQRRRDAAPRRTARRRRAQAAHGIVDRVNVAPNLSAWSIGRSIHPPINPSIYLPTYPSTCLSLHLSTAGCSANGDSAPTNYRRRRQPLPPPLHAGPPAL